jgi:hypothetical protein
MAFRVLLSAADGPLPWDTSLEVLHGTGIEEFRLDQPHPNSEVLFCRDATRDGGWVEPLDAAGGSDAGSGPQPVEALLCELWTDGPADITVSATGYPTVDRTLHAKSETGCIQTVDVELMLERGDGGQ